MSDQDSNLPSKPGKTTEQVSRETLARRLKDLTKMVGQLKAITVTMDRFRTELMQGIATLAKIDGFDTGVLPNPINEIDMAVSWNKKNIKEKVTKEEMTEVWFKVRAIEALGFKSHRTGEDDGHSVKFYFTVK